MDDGRSHASSGTKRENKLVDKEVEALIEAVQSVAKDNAGSLHSEPNQIKQKQAEALEKMSDVFEEATEDFFRTHPDPFDERAPHSIAPGCKLGLLQKSLSEYPEFLDKIVEDFIIESVNMSVQRAACRLLLLTLPGFEVQPTFQSFGGRLIPKLEQWSKFDVNEPLSSLSVGLLGLAMESSEIAGEHKNVNYQLVPKIIKKMQELARSPTVIKESSMTHHHHDWNDPEHSPPAKRSKFLPEEHESDSRSSFTSEIDIRPNHRMNPMTDKRKMTLLLQYLIPMAEYFEHLPAFIEHKVLKTVLHLIQNGDSIIKLETLKLLGSLLCHNRVAIDFIQSNGLDYIIQVPKGSRAAAAVSVCLYYLAFNNDAMERLNQYPDYKLDRVVDYTLDLIETKHDSARVHGIMFFSYGLVNQNLQILKFFDKADGIRRLYNVVSTLKILQADPAHVLDTHAEKTCAKMASVCILRYLEQHLIRLADQYGIPSNKYSNGGPAGSTKNLNIFDLARELSDVRDRDGTSKMCILEKFDPITRLIDMEAPRTLVRLATHASDWAGFAGRLETIKALLHVVAVLSFNNKALILLTQPVVARIRNVTADGDALPEDEMPDVKEPDHPKNSSLSLLIKMAEATGDDIEMPLHDIRKSALFIIQKACCCSRIKQDKRDRILKAVQSHHGIASLLRFQEQPGLRVHASVALAGLCRLDEVKQMVKRLLRPEKLLSQALADHTDREDFRRALEKLLKDCGMPSFQKNMWDPDCARKMEIAKATPIRFNEKELLQLMDAHLREKGYTKVAEYLRKEANIRPIKIPRPGSFKSPNVNNRTKWVNDSGNLQPGTSVTKPNFKRYPVQQRPANLPPKIQFNRTSHSSQSPAMPKKIVAPSNQNTSKSSNSSSNSLENMNEYCVESGSNITLSKIVEFWLRDQHQQCRNPMSTVPEFSLFNQHHCPEPRNKSAPVNATMRFRARSHDGRWGGPKGKELDKKLIWSRYKSTNVNIRTQPAAHATTQRLNTKENLLVLGCSNGDILMYNSNSDRHVAAYNCCSSPIVNLEVKEGLLLTTQRFGATKTTLWNFPDIEAKHDFVDDKWACFAHNSNRIALTRDKEAILWDVEADKVLLELAIGDRGCGYTNNRSLFSPSDDQMLSDGILWDLRSGKQIHRFDKFNKDISGTFNPYSPEIIINSEVWDLRTNRLLKIVPELAGSWPRFSPLGSVILSAPAYGDTTSIKEDDLHDRLGSNIRVLDSRSYNTLYNWRFESSKTKVPRRKIYDFCLRRDEEKINVLESDWTHPEVVSKWYAVGIMPADEDSDQDDDQPEEEEDDDDVSHGISASEGESDNEHEGSINLLNFNNRRFAPNVSMGMRRFGIGPGIGAVDNASDDELEVSDDDGDIDGDGEMNDDIVELSDEEDEEGGDFFDENGRNVSQEEDADDWEDLEF